MKLCFAFRAIVIITRIQQKWQELKSEKEYLIERELKDVMNGWGFSRAFSIKLSDA